jgi:hypothetical protein
MTHPHSTSSALRGHLLLPLIAASALVVLTPRLAVAQSERADCVAIVAEMLAPSPAPDAIRASAGCPVTGPVMLAQHWTRRGARGAEERAALVDASASVRDARLYDAVSSVVRAVDHPIADRLAGVSVLLGYANDGYPVAQQGQALDPRVGRASEPRRVDAGQAIDGSVTLPRSIRADVRRELTQLAREDRDPSMRNAAQRASGSLGYVAPPGARVGVYRKS